MIQQCELKDIFGGPWGVVAPRRDEIEEGKFGVFDRVFSEEIHKNFSTMEAAAETMGCSTSTARRYLRESNARFIIFENKYRFYKPDVEKAKTTRAEKKAAKETVEK